MATIISITKNYNSVMERYEGVAVVEFDATLSMNDVKQLIQKKLALDNTNLLRVLKIDSKFGKRLAHVDYELYDNDKVFKKIEVLPKKSRDKIKADAKKTFEAMKSKSLQGAEDEISSSDKNKAADEAKKAKEEVKTKAEAPKQEEKSAETKAE